MNVFNYYKNRKKLSFASVFVISILFVSLATVFSQVLSPQILHAQGAQKVGASRDRDTSNTSDISNTSNAGGSADEDTVSTLNSKEGEGSSFLNSVRLETKFIKNTTKIIGSMIIEDSPTVPYTIIESEFLIHAQAFGGDVFLPTYREDVVFSPNISIPAEGSNAIVIGEPAIELSKNLPQIKDKYLLKEYEEVDLKVKIRFKVLPASMPMRLVFTPRLDTLLWYPVVYDNGKNDPGIDPETGERLTLTPSANTNFLDENVQVAELGFESKPITLFGPSKSELAIKKYIRFGGLASVIEILRSIFLK